MATSPLTPDDSPPASGVTARLRALCKTDPAGREELRADYPIDPLRVFRWGLTAVLLCVLCGLAVGVARPPETVLPPGTTPWHITTVNTVEMTARYAYEAMPDYWLKWAPALRALDS